jgi:uncharacterized protein YjbI with pentapeptide repeats
VRARPPASPRLPDELGSSGGIELGDDVRVAGEQVTDLTAAGLTARGIELERSRLSGCTLDGARLTRLSVRDCELERCSLAGVLAIDGSMARTRLTGCRLSGFSWAGGTLEDVTFADCLLDLAAFRQARLNRVVFADCVLREADVQDARARFVRFEGSDLTGASFAGATFDSSELRRCTLEDLQGVAGLRGAALEWPAIVGLAGTLAGALGLRVLDDDA